MQSSNRPNRLAKEKSPYLLKHAYNLVYWYPWSEEAFNKAKIENKPIFLSIGYSTCHWCHVMEHESFNDEDIADFLNNYYVAIKVDKEERPDIDHIYMGICQAMNNSGGWPLSILMTPDQKPFFAATYLPKESQNQTMGLMDLLMIMQNKWMTEKDRIIESAKSITSYMKQIVEEKGKPSNIKTDIFDETYHSLLNNFDNVYGGFGTSPKFPTPHTLLYLLRYSVHNDNHKSLEMVEKTLIQMYKGGIFDHIGYGFARYSTDRKWLVPHFEKMTYDNAFLVITYLETYKITNKEIYKEILYKILNFIVEEMTDQNGGFYTAIDADSQNEEGKYYLWDINELRQILTSDEFDYLVNYYNVKSTGNFEGKTILNLIHQDKVEVDNDKIIEIKTKLYNQRKLRVPPAKDDKILTSINGMMIAAFALAGKYLNNNAYIEMAKKSAHFIINNLINDNGRLLARYRNKEAKYLAYLADYAYFIYGLIELFLATSDEYYLKYANQLTDDAIRLFYDKDEGGFYYSGADGEKLIMETKEVYDGAIPSSNSIFTMDLIRLGLILENIKYDEIAHKQFDYFASKINESSTSYLYLLSVYLLMQHSISKIVFVYQKKNEEFNIIRNLLFNKYCPFSEIIIFKREDIINSTNFDCYANDDSEFILHICENNVCEEPIKSYPEIISYLTKEWR